MTDMTNFIGIGTNKPRDTSPTHCAPSLIVGTTDAAALYPQRDSEALGEIYLMHVSAMTTEGLHSKSDIAAQLAWRDARIVELEARQVPEGWQLVPVTMTPEMGKAFREALNTWIQEIGEDDDVYRAILDAAPTAPAPKGPTP